MTQQAQYLTLQQEIDKQITIIGSQNKLAISLGVSSAQLTNIRSGKFDKVSEEMIRKIANKFNLFGGWQIAQTRNIKRVNNICLQAQQFQIAKPISFHPGSGKTTGLKQYANATPNTFYVEAEEYWSKKMLLYAIRNVMGIDDGAMGIGELINSIIEALNKLENPLLIIDEADKLKDGVINLWKSLYNKATAGFILAGTPHFEKRIHKGIRLKKMGYAEIYSRLGGEFIPLHNIEAQDITLIAKTNGITDTNDITLLINKTQGDLRRLKANIELIQFKNLKN